MNPIRIFSLYSGSTGNSFLITDGETSFLIDAGKNPRKLYDSLDECGVRPEQLSAVFVTHTHSDHVSALPKFSERYAIPIHVTDESLTALEKYPELLPNLKVHTRVYSVSLGKFRITSFPTPHDAAGSVGFRIASPCGEIGYATDIGTVTEQVRKGLTGCRAVILESNHDPELLRDGPYPDFLKRRILSSKGHLSNNACAEFSAMLCENGTKQIMLAHLSQTNNTPELAFDCTCCAVGDERVELTVADPDRVTELILEDIPCCT